MKTNCLKVYVKRRKVFLAIYGMPLKELLENYGLIYEILKTIGQKMNDSELINPEEISGACVESEYPDYAVKVDKGDIKIIDFL